MIDWKAFCKNKDVMEINLLITLKYKAHYHCMMPWDINWKHQNEQKHRHTERSIERSLL